MCAQGAWGRAAACARDMVRSLWDVVRIRTFLVIVLQVSAALPTPSRGRPPALLPCSSGAARPACSAHGQGRRRARRAAQGIVGGMPWIAMGYITMWLQLLGFSDWLAGLLTALFWGGTVAGNLLGGLAGDLLVRRLPHAGARPGRIGYRLG